MADDDKQEVSGQEKTPDPVVDGSLSGQIVVFSVLLFLSLVWALFDEIGFERPWKRYQQQFTKLYAAHLQKLRPRQAAAENAVYASPEYKRLDLAIQAAERTAAARLAAIDKELAEIRGQLVVIKDPFQDARAKIASLTYELDHASSERGKLGIRQDIEQTRHATIKLDMPAGAGKRGTVRQEFSFDSMDKLFTGLKAREAQLTAEQNDLSTAARRVSGRPYGWAHPAADWRPVAQDAGLCGRDQTDSRRGSRPGGSLRVVPSGYSRAARAHRGRYGRPASLHQPPPQAAAGSPRCGAFRLLALPQRQRSRYLERGEGARQ